MDSPYRRQEASNYEAVREVEAIWAIENDFVGQAVKRHPGLRVLDVPVGTGRFFRDYAGRCVVGVDLSPHMLDVARDKAQALGLDAYLVHGDVARLPLPERSQDLIITWRLLHLLPAKRLPEVLSELARVTRGEILLQTYEAGSILKRAFWKLGRLMGNVIPRLRSNRDSKAWSHIPSYVHSARTIHTAIDAAGLVVKEDILLAPYGGQRVKAYRLQPRE